MRAYLPYMGMFTIWLNDYPMFKFTVLGLMGFFVLIAKDPQWAKDTTNEQFNLNKIHFIYIDILRNLLNKD